ncbi:MAG: hypothetical protein JNK34_11615 [Tabrizicola sp.]|nr:hypothetical protein [Tabrizicola sp.]
MADDWQSYFQPGETLLWEGAPKPGVYGWPKIVGLGLFGLPFLIVGIGVFATGIRQIFVGGGWGDVGLGLFFAAFAIPFAGVGAQMVFGQWWAAAEAHKRLRYAVSTRCAYVAKSYRTRSIESYPILRGTALGLEKGKDADTVWFHVISERDSDGDRTTTRISFDNIADGDRVYAILRSVQMGTA